MDTRVLWLQKVVQLQLGITAESTEGKNFTETSSVSLTQFLDSINKNFIIVILDERDMKTRIIDQIDAFNPTLRYVIIAKNTNITASTQITLDNIRNSLNIIPLIKSPVNSLYQSLHSVFSPVLLKNTKWGLDNKLLDLISELDSGLGSVIRSTSLSESSSSVTPLANSSIRTFEDEYMYWKDQETALKTSKTYMERARLIRETLEPLKNEFEQLKLKDLSEILEVIDMIQDTYDELWKLAIEPPYPQERMINLLSIAGDQIISAIGTKMSAYKYIMQEPLMKVKDSIITGDQICEKYLFAVSNLTMRYWSHYNQHVWKPVTLDLEVLKMFSSRLNEILNLKTIFEMLADLLSIEEKKSFKVDTITHIFKDINPFSCNKYNDQVWKELCIQFNRLLSPIEEKVAAKLRSLFNDLQNQPGQLMREFKRYAELIQRDSISKYLASEKEVFLNQLISYLKNNQAELKEKVQTTMQSKGRNLPHAVNSIVWASQCLSKVEEAAKLILTLTGLANQYYKTSMELEAEMFKYKKELFAEWVSETELELDRPDGILMLKKTGRLMDLDYQNGKLIINYDDRLVTLLREVRMLVSLGFAVPGRIQSAAEIASQFYRHAVILKQVAHFYNTIDQQMLPSQQSMLLDSALKFEQLVKNPKNIKHDGKTNSPKDSAVSWSSPSELEQYIERLQAAADKLTNDNRKLRKYHEIIIDQVQNLSNVDLVRNQQKQTKSSQVIQRLLQCCLGMTTNTGRVLRPKDSEKLVLYLKDIDLPTPDKYETVELIQFLQQLITYKGFYDTCLEWVAIENVQVVCSMNPAGSLGRHHPSTRFTSIVRLFHVSYTDQAQQMTIYKNILQSVLESCFKNHPKWSLSKNIQKIAASMVRLYSEVKEYYSVDMYPHYIFTLRDLSNWVVNLRRYEYHNNDEHGILDVLAYESLRIFHDKLVTNDHRQKFIDILSNVMSSDWDYKINLKAHIFTTMLFVPQKREGTRVLSELDLPKYTEIISKELYIYERDHKVLNLWKVPETMQRLARMERALGHAGGSILLAGRSGVGRSNCVDLAIHMLKMTKVTLCMGRDYSLKAFSAELKVFIQRACVQAEEVVLVVEDYQLVIPGILESLNSLISGGEIPGLYTQDELDSLLQSIKPFHSESGERCTLHDYFIHRIQKFMHIVLIFDTKNPNFIRNCESNPALYTLCQLDWKNACDNESFQEFAKASFSNSPILKEIPNSGVLSKILLDIHENMSSTIGATTKHFSELLATYQFVLKSKKEEMLTKQRYLQGGLTKLAEASKFVDTLSSDAKKQGVELSEKQEEADQALKKITESMVNAVEQKKEMETLKVQLDHEESKLLVRKEAIERELSDVEPIVRQAKSAVGDIKSESLSEIRSLRAPPPAIRDVLEGVLRLMGNLDMSWNSMKVFLGKRNVKDEILNFDARNISKQIRDSVNKLLKEKAESFEEANIKRSSLAAAPLAMWVKANLKYSAVLERIEPLEEDLRKLSKSLNSSRARVEKLHSELSIVDNAVAELRDGFTGKTREADALKLSLQKANTTIKIAQNLLEKLSGEGSRWTAQSKEISECLKNAPLNTLLSSAFITYLAGQPEHIRSEVCSYWKKTTGAIDFNFLSLMSTESEQLLWKKDGVASDVLSLQNIVVILNSHNIPTLFVDPNGQAISWLKCYLARNSENKYDVIKSHDASFMRSVELAIRFGKTLIVEDVLEIEPLLYPILKKEHIKQGPRKSVQLGEKLVDYNDNFKIYFVSKSSDFALPSTASGLINLVNFTITRSGLAAQLLAITLENENPELEREKLKIIKEEDSLKLSLGKLEESLLKELANSEGNILDNKNLIDSLNETKQKSITIANGLAQSKKTQELLNVEWNKFSPLSNYAAGLFFVLRDLVKLNNMYKFSLPWFLRIFEETLQVKGERNTQETESRIKTLLHNLEKTAYSYVCRSIFKEDHHMFALYLIHMLHKSLFQDKEWDLFLGSILLVDDVEKENNSGIIPPWVPTECLVKIKQIQKVLPKLYDLALFTDSSFWSNWMKRPDCEQNFPSASNISPFQKVIIIQALRPDRLLTAITDFCTKILGIDSLSPPSLSIKAMYENTRPNEPILFITTPGTDPSPELRELANKDIGINNYIEISMGQGQGEYAIESLVESRKTGKWVNLQNIHLVTGWLTELEKFLSDSKNCEIHPKFRLWLTSEAHPKFPMGLLESCLKTTIEAPPGVKNNLSRIYENWSPEFISTGSVLRGQILFSLALFHATIQERRNFLPQGWIKFYEFSNADLRSSAELITNMCKGSKTPQWPILHGILELAVYGGRMDDVFDILKLKTYLRQFFNDEVFIINGRQASKKLIKGLLLPNTTSYQAYLGLIKDFPVGNEANSTNIGLPSNVDQTFQQVSSDTIINQLKHLKQSDISSSNFDRHQWTKELAPFLIIWKKLNSGNDIINKKPNNTAINSPLISFLSLELASALEILRKIHTDLTALSKILKGNVLLSSELSIVATELMRLNVPGSWADMWEGPENPREYMNAVMENTICVAKWNELAIKNDLLESNQIIDLRKFFNPLTFLNALRQLTCRSVNEAIDSLKLISTWSLSDLAATPIKIQVSGLFLQGARFDGNRLSEASAHDKPFETVPNFYLAYVKNDSALYKNRLEVPLYVGRNREKFITCLNVPITAGEEARWIQYGISFFLAI